MQRSNGAGTELRTGGPLPVDPPFDLLVSAEAAIGDLDPVGPSLDRVDLLQRLERAVFDGPNIRSFIDNAQLNWLADQKQLNCTILSHLACGELSLGAVMHHVADLRKRKLSSSRRYERARLMDDSELLGCGAALVGSSTSIPFLGGKGTTYGYADVGNEWARFFLEHRKLKGMADNLALTCLGNGQVLAIEFAEGIRSLIPPETWRPQARISTLGKSYRFLLTRDLPEHWFNAKLGPRGAEERQRKRKAIDWLNKLYQRLLPTKKRAVREDVLAEMRREIGSISNGMFDEIWKEADIKTWRGRGRPADKHRYHFESKGKRID